MVFFTCNHCGDSLKKQSVEKHYAWQKCKGAPVFVTCVDCLKDFRDQEYVGHIKCISEAERYYGKDFQAKPSQNKGQKKQEAWTDIIQNVLTRDDLSSRLHGVLQMLTKHENVPRKKAKFLNFMKNVSRHTSQYDATRIFDLIEEEYTKSKETKNDVTSGQENEKQTTENGVHDQEEHLEGKKSKKKKELTENLTSQEETVQENEKKSSENGVNDHEEHYVGKTSKKRKGITDIPSQEETVQENGKESTENDVQNQEEHHEGKKSKKRRKLSENEPSLENSEEVTRNIEEVDQESKKSKKRKDREEPEDFENTVESNPETFETKKKKKKLKKLKESAEEVEAGESEAQERPEKKQKTQEKIEKTINMEVLNQEITSVPKTKKKKKHFNSETSEMEAKDEATAQTISESSRENSITRKEIMSKIKESTASETPFAWKENILKILEKSNNKIELDKLKKRLLKAFHKDYPDESVINKDTIDLILKRKLKKLKKLKLEDDFVTLKA